MLPKVLWNSLLVTPALLGATLLTASATLAADVQTSAEALTIDSASALTAETIDVDAALPEVATSEATKVEAAATPETASETAEIALPEVATPVEIAQTPAQPAEAPAATGTVTLDQIVEYGNEGTNSMSQVTSISQFSDVQPTDWAYQALQSLVERYGCIVGYPDGTYRGNQALTRYEFAAGLNACLDRISELIAASTADLATREDLATLQRLQEEFAAELATLRGRVDALEARVDELEENQFSTTTKLRGETIFALGIPIDSDDEFFPDEQVQLGYRVRLNFDTSFTGDDLLRARLQARNMDDLESFGGNGIGWQWGNDPDGGSNDIVLDDLLYTFPAGPAQIIVGLNSIGDSDFVATTVSPFDSSGSGSLTEFGTPQQYNIALPGGAGAGAIIQLTDNLSLDFGYAAAEADDPSEGSGLFNGDYGGIAQLSFLSDFVDFALMYANGYSASGFGFTDEDRPEVANTYGAQVNFKFGGIELGGGVAYVPIRVIERGDYDVWSYQATLAFPDLGGEGNLLGIVAGAQPYARGFGDGTFFSGVSSTRGEDPALQVEGFYRFQLTENISITPGLIFIDNPGGEEDVDSTFAGGIRTTFRF